MYFESTAFDGIVFPASLFRIPLFYFTKKNRLSGGSQWGFHIDGGMRGGPRS
jgi:hypothetical protein